MAQYDIIIIGAGMSGLAAGIRLAHFGKRVLICERHLRPGGLNSYYERQGFKLESGLHAITNFARPGQSKSLPLLKILRQLRIPYEALQLREQAVSAVAFPQHTLEFSNDFQCLRDNIATLFPDHIDAFDRLDAAVRDYDIFTPRQGFHSAREFIRQHLADPALTDMLLCPLMYYGSATEHDLDLDQFILLFRAVFHEGLCRPAANGIRTLVELLLSRFQESGGELRLGCGIRNIINENHHATAVETDSGEIITCSGLLSSAGAPETFALCGLNPTPPPGELAFTETVLIPRPNFDFHSRRTITFFNLNEQFRFAVPDGLNDYSSGIICLPHQFRFQPGDRTPEVAVKVSLLANHRSWSQLDSNEYSQAKKETAGNAISLATEILGCDNPMPGHRLLDVFTPKTISRYTGRINGAIYGSPRKFKDAATPVDNLFLCGADQGLLGITGALLGGITTANSRFMM